MNSAELSTLALSSISSSDFEFAPPTLSERGKRNAGKVMKEIPVQRLQVGGQEMVRDRGSRYWWGDGIIINRNSRVGGGFWTNMPPSQLADLRQVTADHPAIFLFCYFELSEEKMHVWAIPDEVTIQSLATVPENQSGVKTVYIDLRTQRFSQAEDSPDLTPYYREVPMTEGEKESLAAAIKQDTAAKELDATDTDDDEDDDSSDDEIEHLYTQETVDFVLELSNRTTDGDWHKSKQDVYWRVLKDPTKALVERLRSDPISNLDSGVAATKRNVSVLKKNDYGRGGYYDHYWAAFFDPEQDTKTKSCQLFFRMLASERQFRYGFAFGNDCDQYIANLHSAIAANRVAVQEYLLGAPEGTVVGLTTSDDQERIDAAVFAGLIAQSSETSGEDAVSPTAPISIIQRFPLEELPERAESLNEKIGGFFRWVWPFFDAARTGVWSSPQQTEPSADDPEDELLDEDAPRTLQELSDLSALSIERLQEIEDALLTKQQIVLTGPPGTSKTYIAQLFARYFAADRETNSQGKHTMLFMHANWAYEDFFEGIKPFTDEGVLKFEPRLGCFLEWIESLAEYRPTGRHVLVLDEINRCDTAAVLGELLQLLEYRGRAVRLLSGRKFRFPSNVYIIGTMNSADRSIGRMDLALRRRFLWLDLVPDYDILHTWLSRTGNNPSRFTAQALRQCNQLLEERGIAPEQQVGHALFMVQTFGSETQESEDKPLIAQALKRIVRFSVLPYVKELCVMQFGRVDQPLVQQIERVLLECLDDTATSTDPSDAAPESSE